MLELDANTWSPEVPMHSNSIIASSKPHSKKNWCCFTKKYVVYTCFQGKNEGPYSLVPQQLAAPGSAPCPTDFGSSAVSQFPGGTGHGSSEAKVRSKWIMLVIKHHFSWENHHFFHGKSTISMAIFNSKLLVYQRVNIIKHMFSKLVGGIPTSPKNMKVSWDYSSQK